MIQASKGSIAAAMTPENRAAIWLMLEVADAVCEATDSNSVAESPARDVFGPAVVAMIESFNPSGS